MQQIDAVLRVVMGIDAFEHPVAAGLAGTQTVAVSAVLLTPAADVLASAGLRSAQPFQAISTSRNISLPAFDESPPMSPFQPDQPLPMMRTRSHGPVAQASARMPSCARPWMFMSRSSLCESAAVIPTDAHSPYGALSRSQRSRGVPLWNSIQLE